jgi:hypothetical protein
VGSIIGNTVYYFDSITLIIIDYFHLYDEHRRSVLEPIFWRDSFANILGVGHDVEL